MDVDISQRVQQRPVSDLSHTVVLIVSITEVFILFYFYEHLPSASSRSES